jgi:hypothetical protein
MSDSVLLRFIYTSSEYAAAYRLYWRRQLWGIRQTIASLTVVGLGLLLHFYFKSSLGLTLAGAGGFFLLFVPLMTLLLPFFYFRREPRLRDEYNLEFSDRGIHFKTAHVDSQLNWSLYEKVLEDDRFFLLLYSKRAFTVIPKRAFSTVGEERRFQALLQEHVRS